MNKAIIGKKIGMSQIFAKDGTLIPVTVVQAGPCYVTQVKTKEKEGYNAIQLAFEDAKEKNVTKAMGGLFKKAAVKPQKYLREVQLDGDYKVGSVVKCDIFAEGDMVDVAGVTKGHGYTGTVKRWNANTIMKSHGTGTCSREVGSMGSNTRPARVLPGKLMPGQYGLDNLTILNLQIARVDTDRNLLLIKGAIPGPRGGLVSVHQAVKQQ